MNHYVFFPVPTTKIVTGGQRFHLEIFSYLKELGAQVDSIPVKTTPRIFQDNFRLIWQMRKFRHSILVVDFYYHPHCFFALGIIKYLFKCKIIISARNIYFLTRGKLVFWLSWLMAFILLKFTDLIVVNSQWTKRELIKRGAKNKLYKLVYPGVELLEEAVSAPTKKSSNRVQLLSVGNCIAMKGIDLLIEAVSMIPKERYHLTIVGDTKLDVRYFNRIKNLVKRKGLEENITFTGYLINDEKWQQYKNADIFVHPAFAEGFGIVLLEAMFFELPIVANRSSAVPELVKDNINGLLVIPNDPVAFAQGISKLMLDEKLRNQMAKRSKEVSSMKAYTWEQTKKRFVAVLENAA